MLDRSRRRGFSIPTHACRVTEFHTGWRGIGLFDSGERSGKSLASTVDGASGRQITNFPAELIDVFHWSPDGKSLGMIRSQTESDVVLLRESSTTTQ